jgi:hypothetical protein
VALFTTTPRLLPIAGSHCARAALSLAGAEETTKVGAGAAPVAGPCRHLSQQQGSLAPVSAAAPGSGDCPELEILFPLQHTVSFLFPISSYTFTLVTRGTKYTPIENKFRYN